MVSAAGKRGLWTEELHQGLFKSRRPLGLCVWEFSRGWITAFKIVEETVDLPNAAFKHLRRLPLEPALSALIRAGPDDQASEDQKGGSNDAGQEDAENPSGEQEPADVMR